MGAFPKQHSSRQGAIKNITLAATAASSGAFGAQTYQLRLSTTSACWYLISEDGTEGATVAASKTNASYLPANVIEYVTVTPGQKLSAIQDSATGTLNITEMT